MLVVVLIFLVSFSPFTSLSDFLKAFAATCSAASTCSADLTCSVALTCSDMQSSAVVCSDMGFCEALKCPDFCII